MHPPMLKGTTYSNVQSRRSSLIRISTSVIATALVFPSFADTFTWDGAGGSGNRLWSNALNWDSNVAPNNDGTDDLFFAGSVKLNPRANGGWDINSMNFSVGAGAFVFSGLTSDEILLEGGVGLGGVGVLNSSANLQTINQQISLGASQTFSAAGAGLLFGGNVNLGSFQLTLSSSGANNITLGNIVSGPGSLSKTGTGSLTLSGANSYSAGTTLSAGTLTLAADTAAGSGSVALNGGTLQASGTRTIANNIVLGSGSIGGSDNLTLSGVVSGSSSLAKNGSGTLRLGSANSASGSVAINAGTLALGANGALGSVSSVTIASGAALTLDSGGGNLVNDSAGLTFAGGTLNANNHDENFGALNLTGSSILNLLDDATDADLTFASFGTLTGGAVLTISGWAGGVNLSLTPGGTADRVFFSTTVPQEKLNSIFFAGNPGGQGAWQMPSGEIIPVPEPSTWALLGASLAVIPFMRRKRA